MSQKTILVWFRNDLRVHDNEILFEAVKKSSTIVPVYCFDPRYFEQNSYGTLGTGVLRTRFLLESVADLKRSLQAMGGDLLVLTGKPEELLPRIAEQYQVTEVYHHREVASQETEISALVEEALWKQQINLRHFIGHTLYHKEELPFPIKDIPDVFTQFRKKIERDSAVRPAIEEPASIVIPNDFEASALPEIGWFGFTAASYPASEFQGGEQAGLAHLEEYLHNQGPQKINKAPRNGPGQGYSSKLSPWIAMGCLSVRKIYWEIKKHEQQHGASDATHALIVELLWRDYFRFMFKKYGTRFFTGPAPGKNAEEPGQPGNGLFEKWAAGATGDPQVDRLMDELNSTGFIGNGARHLAADYLVNHLQVNWTLGAAYFEEKLIDYSPSSNWGNWAQVAGSGKGTGK